MCCLCFIWKKNSDSTSDGFEPNANAHWAWLNNPCFVLPSYFYFCLNSQTTMVGLPTIVSSKLPHCRPHGSSYFMSLLSLFFLLARPWTRYAMPIKLTNSFQYHSILMHSCTESSFIFHSKTRWNFSIFHPSNISPSGLFTFTCCYYQRGRIQNSARTNKWRLKTVY